MHSSSMLMGEGEGHLSAPYDFFFLCGGTIVHGNNRFKLHSIIPIHTKATTDDIERSDSSGVDCVLCRCIHHMIYFRQTLLIYH